MSFRLVPKSVTLNDLEQGNCLYFRYFTEFGSFRGAHCVKVFEGGTVTKVHVRYLIS